MKESQRRASIAMRKMINQRFEFDQPVRHTSFGPPLPLLTLPVMINTLTQLQLPLYLSKGNCDEGIVILANEKNSYILAEDSDFAIYPLSKGYFLLDTLELKEEGVCKLFRSHLALAEKWELDVSYLGLYAVMMGSNLLPTLYLQKFCKRFPWDCTSLLHTHVLELLLEYQSKGLTANQAATTFLEDECCHSTHADFDPSWNLFHDCFYKAIASYKFEEKTSKVEAFSSSDPYGYGLGLEHHLFCPEVVVEPTWRQCVWNVSRPLRRRGYARLLQKESQVLPTIKELIRNHEDFSYKFCDVQPLLDLTLPFNLEEEPNGIFFILHWLMLNNELNLDAFFAFVISFHQKPPSPMVQWSKETYTIDSFRYLALFETCMVSWHVATGKLLYHLIEGPSFHYFYSQIQILHPKKISSVLKNLVQKDQLKTFLDWMYKILGDFLDTSLLVKKNDTWILDWPPSRNE
ncbi:hypothetical protein HMI55_000050 [Coelomomyces lativittatus]|nr:hypothetical protein HMI55_000050 [Coelomomyces lativittatus]